MISTRTRFAAALAVAATSMATLGAVAPAQAATVSPDPTFTPGATDFVGVGSDTTEFALHYLAEGVDGLPGWNAAHADNKVASWGAKGDPVSVRSGAEVKARYNGSSAGKAALFGTGNNPDIDFARSSSGLKDPEVAAGLRAFPFAVDGLKMAVRQAGTSAPASLTGQDIVAIYSGAKKNWKDFGGADAPIVPLIPQSTSGSRQFFLEQLQKFNGGNAVSLSGSVVDTQENSDALLKNDPNAIAPFSTGRADSVPTVKLLDGFSGRRALYNVVRDTDLNNATKGPKLLALFGESGFVCSSDATKLIEAAGFAQLATPSKGGACGQPVAATSNFLVAGGQVTTATATGTARPSGAVTLKVKVAPETAEGKVTFSENGKVLGTVDVDTNATATLDLTDVAKGAHEYQAVFTPTEPEDYTSVTSSIAVTVPDAKYTKAIGVEVPASSSYGAGRTVTVTVANADADATGKVSFVYGDAAETSATLVGGKATFAVPATLAVGTYYGAVSYEGDADFAEGFKLVKFTVAQAKTATTLKLAASKVKVKKSTKATVTVGITGSTLPANGTVVLKIGSTTVGTAKVVNGKATVTIKAQTKTGKKSVKAYFTSSSSNYAGSTSGTATFTVVK